jgi:hypothetical protein
MPLPEVPSLSCSMPSSFPSAGSRGKLASCRHRRGMAVFGLFVTSQLLPEVIRAGNWARNSPVRTGNILMPITSILVYALQLVFAIGVLIAPNNSALLRLSVLVMLGLYAGAIARAWKITRTT